MNEARPHTDQHDTRHAWQTMETGVASVLLRCSRCESVTNNALLASIHPCPGSPAEKSAREERMVRELAASFGGTVESYKVRASGARIETPQTFAAKLQEIGYREPVLPPSVPAEFIGAATCHVRNCGQIAQEGSTMCRDCSEETDAMERYLRARDEYLRALKLRPTLWSRFRELLSRISGGLFLLLCVLLTTLGCVAMAHGVDVPDGIIRGIVKVESGADWHNIDQIVGDWKPGKSGEISHFQLSPSALREMKVEHKAARIAASPLLAESYARKFLLICYQKRGNWRDAVATYNAWSNYREPEAREYARKVLKIAGL